MKNTSVSCVLAGMDSTS